MLFPIKVTQPSYSRPVVTVALIVANILVFLHEISLDPYSLNEFVRVYSLRPYHFHLVNVFTSMFLHANWLHLAGNMLFLWVFGDNVEDILGHGKYLVFYLLCGAAAAFAQVLADPLSRAPMVGASGAIAGVMGAYLVKFPRSRVQMLFFALFFFRFEMPAWFMLAYWFAAPGFRRLRQHHRSFPGRHRVLCARGRVRGGHRAGQRDGRARAFFAAQGSVLVMKEFQILATHVAHALVRAASALVPTPGVSTFGGGFPELWGRRFRLPTTHSTKANRLN